MEKKQFNKKKDLVLFFLEGSKRYFVLSILCIIGVVFFELINPKLIGYTIDIIIDDMDSIPNYVLNIIASIGGRAYVMKHLWKFSAIIAVVACLEALFRFGNQLNNALGAETLVKRMRDSLYDHILHLPYSWQDHNKTGDIIQRCTSDVDTIKTFIAQQLTSLVRMIILITLALVFVFRIHVVLMLINIIFVPIVLLYSYKFHFNIEQSFEKADEKEGKVSAIVQENLTGVRVVRAFGREIFERNRFEKENEEYTNLWMGMMKIMSRFWSSLDIIAGLQNITILTAGSYLAVKNYISPGEFVACLFYNQYLIYPVRFLGRLISEMSKAGISVDRLRYIMNAEVEKDPENAVDYPGIGDVEVKGVSFAYTKEGGDVLSDINFTIKKGTTLGILGGTGSGKSSLIHLLDDLYDLQQGDILINGVSLKDIKRSEVRKHIGIVLQEPYLFSRTLEENIKIAKENATHEEVEEVVRVASLENAINHFKDGYNTTVGERGVTLSGGQKQRTAIAQMLIRKPDICIFDDSLSAVDAQTDAQIRAALNTWMKDSTNIIISHRITTLMNADNIVVLEHGRIIEQGSHEELMKLEGHYKKIFDLQTGGVM